MKENSKFKWDESLEKNFNDSKAKIASLVEGAICTFDTSCRTSLKADWSKELHWISTSPTVL